MDSCIGTRGESVIAPTPVAVSSVLVTRMEEEEGRGGGERRLDEGTLLNVPPLSRDVIGGVLGGTLDDFDVVVDSSFSDFPSSNAARFIRRASNLDEDVLTGILLFSFSFSGGGAGAGLEVLDLAMSFT